MQPFRAILFAFLIFFPFPVQGAIVGPPKPSVAERENAQRKNYQIVITNSKKDYEVLFAGKIDGLRTRLPPGTITAAISKWQPNLFVRIENVGQNDVLNPVLYANGRGPWKNIHHILKAAIQGAQNDAEKARAIYEFVKSQRFHASTGDTQMKDPVRNFNGFGYTECGDSGYLLELLWNRAGLRARRSGATGHVLAEAFYDNGFHLFDADADVIYLKRDNRTVASQQDLVRDHDLVKRTHVNSIYAPELARYNELMAARYRTELHPGDRELFPFAATKYEIKLRPGESIEWRWDHAGKHYSAIPKQSLSVWGEGAYNSFCNGKLIYEPDLLTGESLSRTISHQNIKHVSKDGLAVVSPPSSASIVWNVQSHYVMVGSIIDLEWKGTDRPNLKLEFSRDQKNWVGVSPISGDNPNRSTWDLQEVLSEPGNADYRFFLKLTLPENLSNAFVVKRIRIDTDFQHSCLNIPELESGKNWIRYEDDSTSDRKVRVTHAWVEQPSWRPPAAPLPVTPANASTVAGTQVRFLWRNAEMKGKIVDYHFQLSERKDMRWSLSSNFDKIISRTPSKGKEEWQVPFVGLLNPGQTYFWRVRAVDEKGVWSDWSTPVSFQCRAPGVPLNVRLETQPAQSRFPIAILDKLLNNSSKSQTIVLSWSQNPKGATPVKYVIRGSNEGGFSSASQTVLSSETSKTFVPVAATALRERIANLAYYRVAAVDSEGNESVDSSILEIPAPFIYSSPPETAMRGKEFRYRVQSVASTGTPACVIPCDTTFLLRDEIKYELIDAPSYLRLDPVTGLLSGKFDSNGSFKVKLAAVKKKARDVQQFTVKVSE